MATAQTLDKGIRMVKKNPSLGELVEAIHVKLTRGKVAMVSPVDYARVSVHRWYAHRSGWTWYAKNTKGVGMHRMVLRAPKGKLVDHIDGNGLNNVRSNLRLATHSQNAINRHLRLPVPTHFRGIYQNPKTDRWFAHVSHYGKSIMKGEEFTRPEDAARDYDRIVLMLHGEFAATNESQRLFELTPHEFAKLCRSRM